TFIALLESRRLETMKDLAKAFPHEKITKHGVDFLALVMRANDDLKLSDFAGAHLAFRAEVVEQHASCVDDPEAGEAHHELRIAEARELMKTSGVALLAEVHRAADEIAKTTS